MPAFLPHHPRTRSAVLWGLFVLTGCVLAAMIVATLVERFDPASQGTPGTATVTHCSGQNTNKQCFGSFRSDDGAVRIADTRVWGEDFAQPGQRFVTYYDADDNSVDTVDSGEDIGFNLVVIAWLLVLGFVQFWFRIMIPRQRRRVHRIRTRITELDEGHRRR